MDEVEQLMQVLAASDATSSSLTSIAALERLDRLRDPRVVPFMLRLLTDESRPVEFQIHLVRLLRNGRLSDGERPRVAATLIGLLDRRHEAHLRVQTALALGEFTNISGALAALGNLAVADEPVDIRYAAFTSIQRAGPHPDCVAILRELLADETLGPSIRALLSEWHLA